ncbi:MAG: hypothetical protein RIQ56_547 [Candidatus Parcubacteria bacterium]|jgi:tryptophan synthase alpha subunit
MTNKLEELLKTKAGKGTLFMCHLIAGFPSEKDSEVVAHALSKSGADILEVQIPFSDPMADGPAIAVASRDALENGASVEKTLSLIKRIAKKETCPIVIMSYINPIYSYGIEEFVAAAAKAGASGLIVPDVPFDSEEGKSLLAACAEKNLCMIPVISPGVPKERLQELARYGTGFVYCTSRQGITGANSTFVADLQKYMTTVRSVFSLPLGLGFGVKTRADVARAAELADIVIAGSVFVQAIRSAKSKNAIASAVSKTLSALRR